jgi:hypothetical protein
MEIRYVNHSIGNNFGEYIELNENLKKYPKLHESILNHELSHNTGNNDLVIDLSENRIDNKELLKFIINNPGSLRQFLPFVKKADIIYYDTSAIITIISSLLIISGVLYLIFK